MSFADVKALIAGVFTTDAGKLDVLMIVCALIVLVYALALLVMPFAVWRMRREAIQTRKLLMTLVGSEKATREVLREISAMLAGEIGSAKRAQRTAEKLKALAPKEDAPNG